MNNETEDELQRELDGIYISTEEAKIEIWKRWNDKELRKRVDEFLKNDIPDFLREEPRAILARFITSPNFELKHFLERADEISLRPLSLEYLNDKFVAENIDKYYLAKMYFHDKAGKNGGYNLTTLKVVDFNNAEGKKISDLQTNFNDCSLVDFHHNLTDLCGFNIDSFDISEYYARNGFVASGYYSYFFALFICYGVLFENYLLDQVQIKITRDVVLPNFKRISDIFGVKPLIVRLGPDRMEEDLYWRHYSKLVKDEVDSFHEKNII